MASVHTVFAQICDGVVVNVAVGTYYNCDQAAKDVFGDEAFAVEVTQIPVQPDDIYRDGEFFRVEDGVETLIERIPTDSEKIDQLIAENRMLRTELDTVSLSVLDIIGMEE